MAQVTVTINGRQFRMACEDGQEDHLIGLAQAVDGRIDRLRKAFGEIGDQRLTVMVAIMVADELHEAQRQLREAQAALAAQQAVGHSAAQRVESSERTAAEALHAAAERIERIAQRLAAPRGAPGPGLG